MPLKLLISPILWKLQIVKYDDDARCWTGSGNVKNWGQLTFVIVMIAATAGIDADNDDADYHHLFARQCNSANMHIYAAEKSRSSWSSLNIAIVVLYVVLALNPCDYNNAGCEQQCIRQTSTVPGQLGYRCSCQHGILAPDNHTCVSSSESQFRPAVV